MKSCNPCKRSNKLFDRKAHRKEYYLSTTHGLSTAQYEEMAMLQCGLCAVCGKEETKTNHITGKLTNLAVHHDHDTGKIIALYCSRCNMASGVFGDDPNLLDRAAYLMREGRLSG